jgi:unsaturated pyranuronate lyase
MTTSQSPLEYLHRDWATVPVETIADGIQRQMIWGEHLMVCRLCFAPHIVTPVHSHPHEQITLVERGRVLFTIDGIEHPASAGAVLHFPSGVPHGATILGEGAVLIDIFSPIRQEFLPRSGHSPG